jgi:general secretion pathway protein H
MIRYGHSIGIGSHDAGFTLVELLVVVMILAVVATMSLPLISNSSDGLRLQTATGELAAALRATRATAIVRNAETTLVIDVDRRTFRSAVVSERSFAKDIDARMTFASIAQVGRSDGGFRFFPDGSSTGGDVTLSLHGKEARICVDWVTGFVRQERNC